MGGEFQLPEPIIQHIQSFLTAKQAAQTTILSSSWRKAWLARPNLEFDDSDFDGSYYYKIDEFSKFAKKTIQRYEESNLKIESFRLCMERVCYDRSGLANELIVRALKMGATHLSLRLNDWEFVLPHEVFGAENIVGLSVDGCKIDLGLDPKVRCSRLGSLSLSRVAIESDTISNIISSCPLIEKLSLSHIHELFQEQGVRSVGDGLINLHMLRCLVLCFVKFDILFFGDLSCKFPSLKDLTLQWLWCSDQEEPEEIRIVSRSLERLNFVAWHLRSRVEFDVPSICRFTFEGSIIPSLSFKSTSREWESHVSIKHYNHRPTTLWFRKLNKFLTELSQSKIYFSLNVRSLDGFDYGVGDIQGLPKPEVENLTINTDGLPSLRCCGHLDGLFRLCRPKFVTQYLLPESRFGHDFLCRTNERCSIGSHCMYGLHDVEKVNVQLFDEDLPLKSLLDASTSPEDKQKIRFQLKWKP